jgi:hypothetical protein
MTKTSGAMHVAKITNRRVDKSGQPREYVSHLLRRLRTDQPSTVLGRVEDLLEQQQSLVTARPSRPMK